ncbi:DUF222 domain-containing protein [Fodinicola acaciae]|uniref:DUF222 domain-containing protein n=1 Tax=Fodinicola acaciae TaxID=2681555 RepID=UPI0013D25C7A|nr:DUF222 domain-containing protein [Fodinicola acaciae]
MSTVPPDWPDRDGIEASLATLARSGHPEDVKELGKVIADRVEQETPPPEDDQDRLAEPDRRLQITERLDGRVVIAGSIDQETAIQLNAFMSAFARPRDTTDRASAWPYLLVSVLVV